MPVLFFTSAFVFYNLVILVDLSDYLQNYEVIYPRIRSLESTISPYSLHISFKAFTQAFTLILRESEKIPGVHPNFRLVDGYVCLD